MCRKSISKLEAIRPRLEQHYSILIDEDIKSSQEASLRIAKAHALKQETDKLKELKSNHDSFALNNDDYNQNLVKNDVTVLYGPEMSVLPIRDSTTQTSPTCNHIPMMDTQANTTLKSLRDKIGFSGKMQKIDSLTDDHIPCSKYSSESGVALRPVHVPHCLIAKFLQIASKNTQNNLETCGVLAGKLNHDEFTITCLIVPKQVATSDTCAMINEEEIISVQDSLDVMSLGWIHVK